MPSFKKVLFVDDDFLTVNICGRMMKLVDFASEFVSCENGKQAKNYLLNNTDALPDIIFVDLQMTVMNGWKFLQWYNGWSGQFNVDIPVYVLSSSLYKEDYDRLKNLRITGFFIKPVTVEHLKQICLKQTT
jgi:two-component SAPR family response regulator